MLHAKYSFPSIREARIETRIGSPARQVCSDVGSALVPISENGRNAFTAAEDTVQHYSHVCSILEHVEKKNSKSTDSWTGVTITFLQLKKRAAAVCISLESN